MPFLFAAALALTVDATPNARAVPAIDLEYAEPIAGDWAYAAANDGSEATFSNASGQPQLTICCTRSTRRVTCSSPPRGSAVAVGLDEFSKEELPATYDPATARVAPTSGIRSHARRDRIRAAGASGSARLALQRSLFRRGRRWDE